MGFLSDVRSAFRTVVRMPIVTGVVIASIALGVGVNTVVFSWMQARLLQPLPGVKDGAGLLSIEAKTEQGLYPGSSWLEYTDLKDRLSSFSDLIAVRVVPAYVGESGHVERVFGELVSDNFFSALALQPTLGRFPRPDDGPVHDPVAVISYGLWRSRFGGAPDAIGRTLRINARDFTVVAVAPDVFQGTIMGLNFDVWAPASLVPVLTPGSRNLEDRGSRAFTLLGRLKPGVAREQAQSELDGAMQGFARAYPSTNTNIRGELLEFWESPRGPQRLLTTAVGVLQAIMLLLLLAVCGNTANLVLARSSARQKEIGLRLALGASPRRIVTLLLTESVLLAVVGAAIGAGLAVWGTRALLVLPLTGFPIRFQTSVDVVGLAFAIALGIGCGLIVGMAPALQLSRIDPQRAFRAASKTGGRSRLRSALMGVQVGLALVVLIVAGLFLRAFLETRSIDPGFAREGVLLGAYDLGGRNATPEFTRELPRRLLERLARVPGVEGVALASSIPLDIHGLPSRSFRLEGRARPDGQLDQALSNIVTPGYFKVMKIALVAGTDFADLTDASTSPQAIVNEAFARRYLDEDVPMTAILGRRITARGRDLVITGLVRNSLYNAFGEPPTPIVYLSYRDNAIAQGEIHLRTREGGETALAPELRRAVHDIDPDLPIFNIRTLGEHIDTNLLFRRIPARMFMVLAPVLLLLMAIGIYAVVAYTVSLRTTEIGVRRALGATTPNLLRHFVGRNMSIVLTGGLIGWLIPFVGYVVLSDSPIDPVVFGGVPVLILAVAALACWIPVRRAVRIDPMVALRQD